MEPFMDLRAACTAARKPRDRDGSREAPTGGLTLTPADGSGW
jgi:hypothetical protein